MNEFNGNHGPSEDDQLRALFHQAVSDVDPTDSLDSIRSGVGDNRFRAWRSWFLGAGTAVVATAATITAVAVMGGSPGASTASDPGYATGSSSTTTTEATEATEPTEATETGGDPAPATEPSRGDTTGADGADPTAAGDPPPVAPTGTDETVSSPENTPDTDATQAGSPSTTSTEPSSPSPAEQSRTSVPVYYVGETFQGPRLFREFRAVPAGTADYDALAAGYAVAGAPVDPDYRSGWPAGTGVRSVEAAQGVITVDLEGPGLRARPAAMSAEAAQAAVQQLVYTVQAVSQTRDAVQLTLNGARTDTVLGVPVSEPLAQADPTATLARVWIIDPAQDARLSSGFEVHGLANAYEANVQWELLQGETVVESGFTMAREAYTMAPYSFTVQAPPGEYTLVVHDSDASGQGQVHQDTKRITIVP